MQEKKHHLADPVLVWGIAGASLGMEIAKSLKKANFKTIIGCDISNIAFGHFSDIFSQTYTIDKDNLVSSLEHVLSKSRPHYVIAGGDLVSRLLNTYKPLFDSFQCKICGNSADVIHLASDKLEVMLKLEAAGFSVPRTQSFEPGSDLGAIRLPSVLKPRFDSGGSRGVFVVKNERELEKHAKGIFETKMSYISQEYIDESEGEFTIGVLSDSHGTVAGSIPLRRTFQNLLSVHERGQDFLVSSGSSQGYFERSSEIQQVSESIAQALGSTGPLNIQARYSNGRLLPFEINPRFSASTYLRALSGVNEVALVIEHLKSGDPIQYPAWNEGMALRSFCELFVPK